MEKVKQLLALAKNHPKITIGVVVAVVAIYYLVN
jgi:hypothetical protein